MIRAANTGKMWSVLLPHISERPKSQPSLPQPASHTVFSVSFLVLCETAYKATTLCCWGKINPRSSSSDDIYEFKEGPKGKLPGDLYVITIFLATTRKAKVNKKRRINNQRKSSSSIFFQILHSIMINSFWKKNI